MNQTLKRTILTAGFLLTSSATFAQNISARAGIEFPFQAGLRQMPAGQYEIRVDSFGGGSRHLQVVNRDVSAVSAIVPMYVESHREKARLVFNCSGGGCYLREVWSADGNKWTLRTPSAKAAKVATVNVPLETVVAD